MTSTATVTNGPFRLDAKVPGDMVSLALEEDNETAAATHAAFIDRVVRAPVPPRTRDDMLAQLGAVRRMLKDNGASWLGLAAGSHAGRWALLMISITVTPFDPPQGIAPSGALAAMLRAEHPADAALIEEFQAPTGPAVGVRRIGTLELQDRQIDTGVAQAIVVYLERGALGIVSGMCLNPYDLDLTATLVAGIAARMTITHASGSLRFWLMAL